MSPSKILFVNDAKAYGGAEFYQTELACACLERGWQPTIILPDIEELRAWLEQLQKKNISAIAYNPDDIVLGHLAEKVRGLSPNLIHVNGSNQKGYFRLLAAIGTGRARCILTEHLFPYCIPQSCSWWNALRTKFNRQHWREKHLQWDRCDRLITVNDIYRRVMIGNWEVPASRVECIHNGVNSDDFLGREPARQKLIRISGVDNVSTIILATGRMEWQKGFDFLLAALGTLKKKPWHLVMSGDGRGLPKLREQAHILDIADRVHFLGHRDDLKTFLAGADIFVLPSRNEAIGFSLLEAMVCGVASIGTAVGGVPEVLGDSEYGLLVPSENVRALSGAIHRLLTDRHLRQTLGSKGRDRIVSNFTQKQMIEKTLRVYEELL